METHEVIGKNFLFLVVCISYKYQFYVFVSDWFSLNPQPPVNPQATPNIIFIEIIKNSGLTQFRNPLKR